MESKNNVDYLKSGIWYTVGNICIKGLSFFSLPIFTRLLSSEDFGIYNVYLSYENILYVIIGFGISGTVKIAYFDYKERFNDYMSSIISLTVFIALIIDMLATFFIWAYGYAFPDNWSYSMLQLLIFSSLATSLYTLITTKYVICSEYKTNLSISFFYTIVSVLLSVVLCFVIFNSERALARIIGHTVPLMIITYGISLSIVVKSKVTINKEYWDYALKLGSPLILHSLSMVLMMHIGKLMIDYYLGSSQTGIYSVAVTIASILFIVLGSFDNAWAPWFYRGLSGEPGINLVKGDNLLASVFGYLTAVFMLISPDIIRIMATEEYFEGIYSIIPLVLSCFVNFMYLFAVNQEYFYKKTKTIAVGTIIATLAGILLNYLLIPKFGYITAAFVDLMCKGILFAIHSLIVKRWKKERVVTYRWLFILLILLSVIGYVTILCKDSYFVRYLIIIMLTIMISKPLYKLINFRQNLNIVKS